MHVFVNLLFILATVYFCAAQNQIIPNDPEVNTDPKYHCFTKFLPEIGGLAKGQTLRMKDECKQVTCMANKDIEILGCGAIGLPRGCEASVGDLSKPHPDCCYIVKC
ncbi:unnamed protein product [Acanthoscelides obtectus]|uniref:Single domain-containing protein n=1 Tax=Acanthoscelides obtectus TaxID=200917 RepID=A0A9P0JQ87_ACAOB|nr:unnamed protein product [Acanthoscelides obtectus]CAK1679415.1 hypothetical protein AOBTE_LOCUS32239 [Acanthoscelides obtectus]